MRKERSEMFHKIVAKGLFASKRARPDILQAITYLCTKVKAPNENDWLKLRRMMEEQETTY